MTDDHGSGAARDVPCVERMVRMSVRDQDVVGPLHAFRDERGVGKVETGWRNVAAAGTPATELCEERVDQHYAVAVRDLPARIAEIRESYLAGLEGGGRG